jgi:hypothetical protein
MLAAVSSQDTGTQNTEHCATGFSQRINLHAVEQLQLYICSHYNVLIIIQVRSEHNSDEFKMLFYRLTSVAMIFQTSQVHTAVKLCHNTELAC